MPGWGQTAVTFVIMLFGWVLFRAPDLGQAIHYWGAMVGLGRSGYIQRLLSAEVFSPRHVFEMLLCVAFVWQPLQAYHWVEKLSAPKCALCAAVLVLALCMMFTQTYNPFLYFSSDITRFYDLPDFAEEKISFFIFLIMGIAMDKKEKKMKCYIFIGFFLALIYAVPVTQAIAERLKNTRIQALDIAEDALITPYRNAKKIHDLAIQQTLFIDSLIADISAAGRRPRHACRTGC